MYCNERLSVTYKVIVQNFYRSARDLTISHVI